MVVSEGQAGVVLGIPDPLPTLAIWLQPSCSSSFHLPHLLWKALTSNTVGTLGPEIPRTIYDLATRSVSRADKAYLLAAGASTPKLVSR